jgi:DNA-binding winged helix-turn-helix (wHTH) protein
VKTRLRFGDWTYDGESRELRGPNGAVHVSPKAFDLLGTLLESRPRALSKAELRDRLWAQTVVADSNLASLVREIRKALGDVARRPAFLRTVHGFGYAFCGQALEVPRAAAPPGRSPSCRLIWALREILLTDGENVLGRGMEASPRIAAVTVSRRHARLVVSAQGATIEDLGSKNGTYVRGLLVTGPTALADGDEIRLGSVRLTLRVVSGDGSTDTYAGRQPDA